MRSQNDHIGGLGRFLSELFVKLCYKCQQLRSHYDERSTQSDNANKVATAIMMIANSLKLVELANITAT